MIFCCGGGGRSSSSRSFASLKSCSAVIWTSAGALFFTCKVRGLDSRFLLLMQKSPPLRPNLRRWLARFGICRRGTRRPPGADRAFWPALAPAYAAPARGTARGEAKIPSRRVSAWLCHREADRAHWPAFRRPRPGCSRAPGAAPGPSEGGRTPPRPPSPPPGPPPPPPEHLRHFGDPLLPGCRRRHLAASSYWPGPAPSPPTSRSAGARRCRSNGTRRRQRGGERSGSRSVRQLVCPSVHPPLATPLRFGSARGKGLPAAAGGRWAPGAAGGPTPPSGSPVPPDGAPWRLGGRPSAATGGCGRAAGRAPGAGRAVGAVSVSFTAWRRPCCRREAREVLTVRALNPCPALSARAAFAAVRWGTLPVPSTFGPSFGPSEL